MNYIFDLEKFREDVKTHMYDVGKKKRLDVNVNLLEVETNLPYAVCWRFLKTEKSNTTHAILIFAKFAKLNPVKYLIEKQS